MDMMNVSGMKSIVANRKKIFAQLSSSIRGRRLALVVCKLLFLGSFLVLSYLLQNVSTGTNKHKQPLSLVRESIWQSSAVLDKGLTVAQCEYYYGGYWEMRKLAHPQTCKNVLIVDQFSLRKLQSLSNCTPRAVEQFPGDIFSQEERSHGAVVIHFVVVWYMFLALAITCDDYFVPSLEVLCEVFHLQPDVAGATFMAAGSSAPELVTSVIGVFIAKDDIGLGAVVGSAVYNVTFVISMCALFSGGVVYLSWWPLFRDCFFYALCVGALIFIIMDEKVFWYEATGLLCIYVVYIIFMYFNSRLEKWVVPKCFCQPNPQKDCANGGLYEKLQTQETCAINNLENAEESEVMQLKPYDSDHSEDEDHIIFKKETKAVKKEEKDESVFSFPTNGCFSRFLWIISLPLTLLLYISVPDCRKNRWRKFFFLTFIMSLAWICIFSYLMVWMITVVGYTMNIPDSVMALTFIAFGVSLPDALASVFVSRDGFGDMAVANAVGSNQFDILVCLGLPWLIQTLIKDGGDTVEIYSEGLVYSALTLLSTVVFLLTATHLNGWKLTKKYGIILLVVYVVFTIISILYELNIFGYVHPPECDSNY